MTDKPTPEQIQRANALAQKVLRAKHWEVPLDDTITQLDAMQARAELAEAHAAAAEAHVGELQAERDKARADLGEIAALLEGQPPINSSLTDAQAIAAPYRVETDPLLLEAREIAAASDNMVAANVRAGEWDNSHIVQCCLAALKRGLEIGRSA